MNIYAPFYDGWFLTCFSMILDISNPKDECSIGGLKGSQREYTAAGTF